MKRTKRQKEMKRLSDKFRKEGKSKRGLCLGCSNQACIKTITQDDTVVETVRLKYCIVCLLRNRGYSRVRLRVSL